MGRGNRIWKTLWTFRIVCGILKINSTSNKTSLLLSTKIKKEIFERILALVTNEPNNYSINKDNKFIINKEEGDHVKRREMVFSLLNEII